MKYTTEKRTRHMAAEAQRQLGPDEVSVDELVRAIKEMMVDRFAGRQLRWETAEKALALTSFELKQLALFTKPSREGVSPVGPTNTGQQVSPSRTAR